MFEKYAFFMANGTLILYSLAFCIYRLYSLQKAPLLVSIRQ